MKSATTGLANLINSGVFMDVTLYTIALAQNAGTLYISAADFDVNYGGNTFLHGRPGVDVASSKPQAHWKAGLDVDEYPLTLLPRLTTASGGPDMLGSATLLQAAVGGAFDGALVTVQRAYFSGPPAWPQPPGGFVPVGVLPIFFGMAGEVTPTAYEIPINVQSLMGLLKINTPRNVYQAQCRHILYDSGCTLARASYTTSYVVGSATQNSVTASAAVPAPSGSGTYQFGRLTFTSGANNGVTVTILSQSVSTFLLYGLPPYLPAPGDTFTVSAGCDKQPATCSLFGNLVNFGGTPNIPVPEVTVP